MNDLVRWDPFRSPFDESIFGIVPSLLAPVRRSTNASWGLRMDIGETDNAYKLAIEVPGASRDQIDVSVYGNSVTFSVDFGESKEEGESWLLRERGAGKVTRTVTLPEEVDDSASEAKYADGVLHVTLRKKRASQTKRLTIN